MTEIEIKSLTNNNRWITVQPTRANIWKGYIYKQIS